MTVGTGARSRVLLVEDEAMIAMLMEDMLSELECDVVATVGELQEALAIAGTGAFDLAFLDVNLRGSPVYPVAAALCARGIPFAFVTGYGTSGVDPAHPDAPVLQKPFQGRDLEAVLARLRPGQPR
jgi:CheY-like chemotaxis protein